jgi:hypothetical protein
MEGDENAEATGGAVFGAACIPSLAVSAANATHSNGNGPNHDLVSLAFSPNYLEGAFSEVGIQHPA